MESPLDAAPLFWLGPVPVKEAVLITWGLMLLLAGGSWWLTRRLARRPTSAQAFLELVVETIAAQIEETARAKPEPYLPLIGTLFVFVLFANWCSLIPGIEPPTATLETDIALGLIVFVAVIGYGVRARGLGAYLRGFAEPSLFMLPLNIIEQITRSFSLMIRLFGNVMSGVFVVGIVTMLAGLLVPVPLMALELLTGGVQAYIFSVLAMVFIGGAVEGEGDARAQRKDNPT